MAISVSGRNLAMATGALTGGYISDDDGFDVPSFQDFIEGAKLKVLTKNGPLLVSVHDENVSVKVAKKLVIVEIESENNINYKTIKLS